MTKKFTVQIDLADLMTLVNAATLWCRGVVMANKAGVEVPTEDVIAAGVASLVIESVVKELDAMRDGGTLTILEYTEALKSRLNEHYRTVTNHANQRLKEDR